MPQKNGGSGGEFAAVGPTIRLREEVKDELERILKTETTSLESYDWTLRPEAKDAAFSWLHLYHGLVFLAAAIGKAKPELIDPPDEGDPWKYGHRVPAFTIGGEGEIGWFFPELMGLQFAMTGLKGKYLEALNTPTVITEPALLNHLTQTVELEETSAPLLKHFLTRLKMYVTTIDHAETTGLVVPGHLEANWLNLCYASIAQLNNSAEANDHTASFVQSALHHFSLIWGTQPTLKVNFVKAWLPLIEGDNDDFIAEFGSILPLAEAQTILSTGTEQDRQALNMLLTLLKDVNRTTYWHIYKRLTSEPDNGGLSHCLENMVTRVTALLTDDNQKFAWRYLLLVTCSAIAWEISQQLSQL